jgi:hypothetical protein
MLSLWGRSLVVSEGHSYSALSDWDILSLGCTQTLQENYTLENAEGSGLLMKI